MSLQSILSSMKNKSKVGNYTKMPKQVSDFGLGRTLLKMRNIPKAKPADPVLHMKNKTVSGKERLRLKTDAEVMRRINDFYNMPEVDYSYTLPEAYQYEIKGKSTADTLLDKLRGVDLKADEINGVEGKGDWRVGLDKVRAELLKRKGGGRGRTSSTSTTRKSSVLGPSSSIGGLGGADGGWESAGGGWESSGGGGGGSGGRGGGGSGGRGGGGVRVARVVTVKPMSGEQKDAETQTPRQVKHNIATQVENGDAVEEEKKADEPVATASATKRKEREQIDEATAKTVSEITNKTISKEEHAKVLERIKNRIETEMGKHKTKADALTTPDRTILSATFEMKQGITPRKGLEALKKELDKKILQLAGFETPRGRKTGGGSTRGLSTSPRPRLLNPPSPLPHQLHPDNSPPREDKQTIDIIPPPPSKIKLMRARSAGSSRSRSNSADAKDVRNPIGHLAQDGGQATKKKKDDAPLTPRSILKALSGSENK